MNTYPKIMTQLMSLILFVAVSINTVQAQEFKLNNQESFLTVLGTSSLHDWHILADQQSGEVNFVDLKSGKIESLSLSVVAESLKSGKSSMDKNTYKALKTDDYKSITFQLTGIKSVDAKEDGSFMVKALGDLTIAGTKKNVAMDFTISVVNSKIKITGSKEIKMTDFNVDPPKALFGTITTGNEITIKFSTIFK